ncbi:hypothetical protein FHQ18_11595 [Deferribacter autotrophicus]|uniref:Uncharacterized protein n=1 Tax=Deferribacter autotrophicus TaxID=500465 RepID=A0A5A8F1D8_9BACT|nr:hypothetical protein [Deferribacter autotrophicus]KAA0257201.1 hypothetical protein FHQ18_11595 [Deferribacter autotrophicus]
MSGEINSVITTFNNTITTLKLLYDLIKELKSTIRLNKKNKLDDLEKDFKKVLRELSKSEKIIKFYIEIIPKIEIAAAFADKIHEIITFINTQNPTNENFWIIQVFLNNIKENTLKIDSIYIDSNIKDDELFQSIHQLVQEIKRLRADMQASITNKNIENIAYVSKSLSDKLSELKEVFTISANRFAEIFRELELR